jgi:UDP-N-acetyl-D-glucosamine dehydrogenase
MPMDATENTTSLREEHLDGTTDRSPTDAQRADAQHAGARGTWDVAIIGAGYVGVPLAQTFADAGQRVLLVDTVPELVEGLNRGESHIEDVPTDLLRPHVETGRIAATLDYGELQTAHAVLFAVPTPLTKQREPDLSVVENAARAFAAVLQPGQVVVLESTTYPGTTREVLLPILEEGSGLVAGEDFHLAMSPERVDPGRTDWTTKTTPKILGGLTPACSEAAAAVYRTAVDTVHTVSSPEAAELTKLLENIFRSVNIALVNELAQLCDRMNIDVWEVVGAAATKPFGFMSFQPGPGLGGHCIPLDPFYLSWKAKEYDFTTRFIDLSGEINNNMPYFCRSVISQAMNHGLQRSLSGSRVLILGVAYKADIGDTRETPAEKLIHLLRNAGAEVAYHDPHVPEFEGMASMPLVPEDYDCVAVVTAHSVIDYADVVRRASVVVDFRNATGGLDGQGKVWKL